MEAINQSAAPSSAQANINAIVRLEEQSRQERTPADHISDVIASFVGSIPFVVNARTLVRNLGGYQHWRLRLFLEI